MKLDRQTLLLPGAIIAAGAIIAIAVYMVRSNPALVTPEGNVENVRPVSPEEHIAGNPEAPVVVITYSDIDCEYCKDHERMMAQLVSEYAPKGQLAWVYRHFPLLDAHPNSGYHAEAAECAAQIAGADMFWRFIDAVHAAAPGVNQFDPRGYDSLIDGLGIDPKAFNECIASDRMLERVGQDLGNAIESGADGTPYTILLVEGKKPVPISGALPYAAMKEIVDRALTGS